MALTPVKSSEHSYDRQDMLEKMLESGFKRLIDQISAFESEHFKDKVI